MQRLGLSPDGTTLLTAGVQSVYAGEGGKTWGAATLWDAQTGQVRCIMSTSEGQRWWLPQSAIFRDTL
ncbi:hypothetical protein [Armatimonas sp.]|uniref:hypothetical protein n=1 Tax=Armatimonas sp. TaxID=1872638 RepID=UPI0037521C0E